MQISEDKMYQIILILIPIFSYTFCYRFEPNTLTLENFFECSDGHKNLAHINQNITRVARNKYVVNGELSFDEYFPEKLEVFERSLYSYEKKCFQF